MVRAASATLAGVSLFAGSLTSSRVKFCASADDPALLRRRVGNLPGHREALDRLLVVPGAVAVGLEIAENGAFHGKSREIVAIFDDKCDPF